MTGHGTPHAISVLEVREGAGGDLSPRAVAAGRPLRVALEQHFVDVGGRVYTDIAFGYDYWREYLDVFELVQPIARIRKADRVPDGWVRADGPGVQFQPVHDYLGFWAFLRCWPRVLCDCRRGLASPGPILLRMGPISLMCSLSLVLARRAYGLEVVGHGGAGATTVRNVQAFGLGRLIGATLHWLCGMQARRADCASYVSEFVRRLYPTRSGREWVFSSVRLPDTAFARPRAAARFTGRPLRIVSVGRVEPEKGHQVLVEAVSLLARRSIDVRVTIAGPGSRIEALRHLAERLGIAERVRLPGMVPPGAPLHHLLREHDLFVLPSLTEGMPRALIEAMAAGLPAIGSATGGIVELLDGEAMVPPGDAGALADRIGTLIAAPDRLAGMSARSVAKAQEYRLDLMTRRKQEFWRCLRDGSVPDGAPWRAPG